MALSDNEINKYITDFMYQDVAVKTGAVHFYRGSNVSIDATGYAILGADTASTIFVGVADAELDQAAGGSSGDYTIRVIAAKSGKVVKRKLSSVAITDLYVKCYIVDDEEVGLIATTTNDIPVGTIVALAETNYCWVLLDQ